MTRIPFFGAAVALSALFASHASAQHMIDEPGMYAFYHPNGDLGIGHDRVKTVDRGMGGFVRPSRAFSLRLLQRRMRSAEIRCCRILADLDDAAADGAGAGEVLEQRLAVVAADGAGEF